MGCPGLTELNMSPTLSPELNNLTSFVGESPASHKGPSSPRLNSSSTGRRVYLEAKSSVKERIRDMSWGSGPTYSLY